MLEVIDTVKRVSVVDFKVELTVRGPGHPAQVAPPETASALRSNGSRV
jgi:hypothetical protein